MNSFRQKLIVIPILFLFLIPTVSYASFEVFGGKIVRRYDILEETVLEVNGKYDGGRGKDYIVLANGPSKACLAKQFILGYGVVIEIGGKKRTSPILSFCMFF